MKNRELTIWIRDKYLAIAQDLDERARRRWAAAAEARSLGWGGISVVAKTRLLALELRKSGFAVSSTKVGSLLKAQGYSLQSNRKTIEGKQHPDRNDQCEYIAKRVKIRQRAKGPAISVDTKKKERLGNLKNPGKTFRRKGSPVKVKTHDFPDKELGKAIPYGV